MDADHAVTQDVAYPGLVWVKDPVDLETGQPNGKPPRKRHHDDCWHWFRDAAGNLLGPPPYRASDEQMRTLSHCETCAESHPGTATATATVGERRGGICGTCFMEMPITGHCSNCA